jgi:hypothetical protein
MHCTILIVVILCIYGRSRKAKDGNPSGASPTGVGGPQVTSYKDANIVVIKASVHLTTIIEFILFFFHLTYDSWMCISF